MATVAAWKWKSTLLRVCWRLWYRVRVSWQCKNILIELWFILSEVITSYDIIKLHNIYSWRDKLPSVDFWSHFTNCHNSSPNSSKMPLLPQIPGIYASVNFHRLKFLENPSMIGMLRWFGVQNDEKIEIPSRFCFLGEEEYIFALSKKARNSQQARGAGQPTSRHPLRQRLRKMSRNVTHDDVATLLLDSPRLLGIFSFFIAFSWPSTSIIYPSSPLCIPNLLYTACRKEKSEPFLRCPCPCRRHVIVWSFHSLESFFLLLWAKRKTQVPHTGSALIMQAGRSVPWKRIRWLLRRC